MAASMARIRGKLDCVVRLHEESKSAFQILESQVKAGLLEAEEIFASLSVPLMHLVNLKSKEMSVEGRSCTIVMTENVNKDVENVGSGAEWETRRIAETEGRRLNQIVSFLRSTESTVNSHLDAIYQRLTDRRSSIHKAHQAIVAHLANAAQEAAASPSFLLAINVQRATFRSFDVALLSVAEEVESAVCRMAEDICRPLLGFAKGMKADRVGEAARRMLAAVVEMEAEVARRGIELQEARKRIRRKEEANRSARKRLAEYKKEVRRLRQKVEAWEMGFCNSFDDHAGGVTQSVAEKHQTLEDKLLWQLLKDSQKQAHSFSQNKLTLLANHIHRRTTYQKEDEEEEDQAHYVNHAGATTLVANPSPGPRSTNKHKKPMLPRNGSSSALMIKRRPATRSHFRGILPATPTVSPRIIWQEHG